MCSARGGARAVCGQFARSSHAVRACPTAKGVAHLGAQPYRALDTEVTRVHEEVRGGLAPGRLPEAVDGRSSAVGAERREQPDAEAERCRVVQPRQAAPPFLRPTAAAVEAPLLCACGAEHARGHHGQVGLAVRARGHARRLAHGRHAPWRRRALGARGGCGGAARQQQLLELVVWRDGPLEAEAARRLRPRGERVEAKLEHPAAAAEPTEPTEPTEPAPALTSAPPARPAPAGGRLLVVVLVFLLRNISSSPVLLLVVGGAAAGGATAVGCVAAAGAEHCVRTALHQRAGRDVLAPPAPPLAICAEANPPLLAPPLVQPHTHASAGASSRSLGAHSSPRRAAHATLAASCILCGPRSSSSCLGGALPRSARCESDVHSPLSNAARCAVSVQRSVRPMARPAGGVTRTRSADATSTERVTVAEGGREAPAPSGARPGRRGAVRFGV
eukprot:scaffold80228_cov68-Phaeocystis_antarctica.AAC.8